MNFKVRSLKIAATVFSLCFLLPGTSFAETSASNTNTLPRYYSCALYKTDANKKFSVFDANSLAVPLKGEQRSSCDFGRRREGFTIQLSNTGVLSVLARADADSDSVKISETKIEGIVGSKKLPPINFKFNFKPTEENILIAYQLRCE